MLTARYIVEYFQLLRMLIQFARISRIYKYHIISIFHLTGILENMMSIETGQQSDFTENHGI